MKLHAIAALLCIGAALTGCAHHHLANTSPAYYNPGCYANIYDHTGFRGGVVQVRGPSTYSSLRRFEGRDWDKRIGSLQTGPNCWLVLYRHKDFKDNRMVVGPNTTASNLGKMSEEAESIQVLDHLP